MTNYAMYIYINIFDSKINISNIRLIELILLVVANNNNKSRFKYNKIKWKQNNDHRLIYSTSNYTDQFSFSLSLSV